MKKKGILLFDLIDLKYKFLNSLAAIEKKLKKVLVSFFRKKNAYLVLIGFTFFFLFPTFIFAIDHPIRMTKEVGYTTYKSDAQMRVAWLITTLFFFEKRIDFCDSRSNILKTDKS